MTATAGQPVVTGSAIDATVFNNLVTDLIAEFTDSLSRSGKGAMLQPFKLLDGAVGAPGLTFGSETSSGLYRAAAGDVRLAILGAAISRWTATALELVTGALYLTATGATANTIRSSVTDAATAVGVVFDTVNTLTNTAKLASWKNNTSELAYLMRTGALHTEATEGVSDTPTADWTVAANIVKKSAGLVVGYCSYIATVGTAAFTSITTLPAGARPSATTVQFVGTVLDSDAGLTYPATFTIATTGVLAMTLYDNGTSLVAPFAIGTGDTIKVAYYYSCV